MYTLASEQKNCEKLYAGYVPGSFRILEDVSASAGTTTTTRTATRTYSVEVIPPGAAVPVRWTMFVGIRLDADGSGMMMVQRLENEGSEAAGVGNTSVQMYVYNCNVLEPVADQPGIVRS